MSDLTSALAPVLAALNALDVPYFVGGSVASSAHGIPRASLDVDVIVALDDRHVDALMAALGDAYYASWEAIHRAVVAKRAFNLIHLETMFKVDLFVAKGRPYDDMAFRRARPLQFDDMAPIQVASPEDTILAKLEWFRAGGEVSERQWSDVVGVIEGNPELDRSYLRQWAPEIGVADLLERALGQNEG